LKNSVTKLRVRYSETDQMGIVYYGNYAQYLEQGRTDWLRSLGLTYKFIEEHQVMLPVINLNIDYKKPAKYDDLLTIKTSLLEIPSVKIKFYYEIHNQDDELLVTATTSLVFIDSITRKLIKAPGYLLEKLL
jgi:acyl-CoA thioester hydrolase